MRSVGFLAAAGEMTDLGWRQTLRSKMLVGIGVAALFAAGVAFVIYQYSRGSTAAQNYQALQALLLATVIVPLIALLLGTGVMATEREAGTLAYLFTRPFRRSAVVVGKAAGAILVAVGATALTALLVFLASGAPGDADFLPGLAALSLEAAALTALFVLFGTLLARSLYLGLAYVALFEGLVGNSVGARSGWTITYHARNLLEEWSYGAWGARPGPLGEALPGSAADSVFALLVVVVLALVAASVWVETREYGLKDRPKEE